MRKATLSPNPIPQNKQRFIVEGLPECDRIITRDAINLEIATADRPDKTKVPIGRVNPGDFGITLDFADDKARNEYLGWFEMCIDRGSALRATNARTRELIGAGGDVASRTYGGVPGIDPKYKKLASIIYQRLYIQEPPIVCKLIGVFPSSCEFPDYDMDGEDLCTLSMTLSYDDVEPIGDFRAFGNSF
jgi:hypothetical protein